MTETFTASNGISITTLGDGQAEIVYPVEVGDSRGLVTGARPRDMAALREFFRAEEDKRLGRWRWAGNPDYVVYPVGEAVRVLSESTGTNRYPLYRPVNPVSADAAIEYKIAEAYFNAHPEPEPKPWHDAKPGEVWVLTFDGTEGVFLHAGGYWYGQGDMRVALEHPIRDVNVTAGRRIYPVGE